MANLPHFPAEVRHRICVQSRDTATDKWGEPREITTEQLIAMMAELPDQQRQRLADAVGMKICRQLADAEIVIDAFESAQHMFERFREHGQTAIERAAKYREAYPKEIEDDIPW